MVGQPASVRILEERFQHSGETISRQFHSVLNVVCGLARDIIKPIDSSFSDVPDEIKNDVRYYPYFKDCIGAIDGTHIRVCVPPQLQATYIGRKGYTTTNVMAACDFNMCFTFVWAGWEGSAHDAKIFMEALRRPSLHFPHPPHGKYYLVDAGYPTFMGFLGPYKKNRYHLPQFRNGPRITGRVEVFNYYHSSLRNVIERSFGCCKAKWKILGSMPSYDLKTQNKIITACMALHNFIRRNDRSDEEFDANYENEDGGGENEAGPSTVTWEEPDFQSSLQMEQIREHIKNMFPTRV
ncbi:uncharacterized protein LOC130735922 [Lotus japonicus]|uniref:uncharacterized protein LOC130735922 n=1 Tax=Lotus japonicus TaxID=34305 RepID=UPI00258575FE|nr:uncharacterized protein LOC130735922 [Lotus japonicus]